MLTGALLQGDGLEGAVLAATAFTRRAVARTMLLPTPVNYGVDLEPLLPLLWDNGDMKRANCDCAKPETCRAAPVAGRLSFRMRAVGLAREAGIVVAGSIPERATSPFLRACNYPLPASC